MAWAAAAQLFTTYLGYRASRAPSAPRAGSPGLVATTAGVGGAIALPGLVRAGGGAVVRGAKSLYNSAATYCRRHPGWCSTVGGIAAVEALVGSGQLPPIKRRRAKGISATELRSFRRVARFFSGYCPSVRRARTARKCR